MKIQSRYQPSHVKKNHPKLQPLTVATVAKMAANKKYASGLRLATFLAVIAILYTLKELIFAGTNFCGSQFRDYLRELNFGDFSLKRKLEPLSELFD